MNDIAARAGAEKPRVRPMHTPTQADHFRDLARRFRQLGRGNSRNPLEHFIIEKLDVASALDQLAEQAEGAR
jgi:hypothetical protein